MDKNCRQCSSLFKVKPYRDKTAHFCSKKCLKEHKKALIFVGQCIICEKEFSIEQWKIRNSQKGIYCSRQCYKTRSPQINIECVCGKLFKAYQSRISYYGRLYCNKDCYLKNGFFGRLTNDIPEVSNYGKFVASLRSTVKYLKWRQECYQRDKEKCISCNSVNNLTIHHKFSLYEFVKKHGLNKKIIEADSLFFDVNNGETLCRSCHLNHHKQRDKDEQDN